MSWFNRKKNPYDTSTDDYLRSTDTVGRPLAVVFIILMVFVVGAAVFSLFLGGKWLYNNLDGKSTPNSGIITEQPSSDTKPADSPSNTNTSNTNTTNSGTTTTGTGQTTTSNTNTSGAATSTPQQTPTMLPNTGPEPE